MKHLCSCEGTIGIIITISKYKKLFICDSCKGCKTIRIPQIMATQWPLTACLILRKKRVQEEASVIHKLSKDELCPRGGTGRR
jgi:hypothetical protein